MLSLAENHEWLEYRCISKAQVRWNTKGYLKQTLVFLVRVELKKINPDCEDELTHLFWESSILNFRHPVFDLFNRFDVGGIRKSQSYALLK